MKVKVTRMTSGRSSTRPGLLTLSLVVAATSAVLLIGSASSEPSPSPFVDVGRFVERLPPLVRRLLSPTRTSRQHQQQAKSLPDAAAAASSFQRKTGELEAEVVVDDSVAPPAAGKNETAVRDDSAGSQEQVKRDGSSAGVGGGVNATDSDEMGAKTEVAQQNDDVEETQDLAGWTGRLMEKGRQLATNLLSLSNLAPLLYIFGVVVDSNNQKVTVDTTALICALIVIFIPIIIGWLIIVYAWIIMSMVEFDYTVYGQFPRPLPTPPAASRMDIISGALRMFRLAYNRYMNADEDPPLDHVAAAHPDASVLPEDLQLKEYLRNPDYDPLKGHADQYFDVDDNTIRRRSGRY